MYDELSAVAQSPTAKVLLCPADKSPSELTPKKLRAFLSQYRCFPSQYRKALWTHILRLPRNEAEYRIFASKPPLPQAKKLCTDKGLSKVTIPIFNSLVHWHAPLINCEWLPFFVDKITRAFPRDPLFCFEVVVTFLTNYFSEWLSEVPGPPSDVVSRIDAIFANDNPKLRDSIGNGFIGWPAYRSCFAEILYDHAWFEVMDVVLSAPPQFLEYLVVSWLEINSNQLLIDPTTFHSTKRPVDIKSLIGTAEQLFIHSPPSLYTYRRFTPLSSPQYPMIEASTDAVVLRALQSDYNKMAQLQKQLSKERESAEQAEKAKLRRKQTLESVQEVHRAKENEEKSGTAKEAVAIEAQMKRLRLEGQKMRLNEEEHFMDQWMHEWETGLDLSTKSMKTTFGVTHESAESPIDSREASLEALRQNDSITRQSRKSIVARAKQARSELDSQLHQRLIKEEIRRLSNDPDLLTSSAEIRLSESD